MDQNYQIILPAQQYKLRFLDKFMENHKGYIAGGCFKNLFAEEKIKDVDIFFNNSKDYKEGVSFFHAHSEWDFAYELENRVVSFKDKKSGIRVELIASHYDSPEVMLNRFDFTITKIAYVKDEETGEFKAIVHNKFFEHLMTKKLVIDNNIPFPISTFNRMLRYVSYGFKPCTETKKRLLDEIQRLGTIIMPNDFYAGID